MNTKITEDYVSFEVAKLLKEKGFDKNLHWQQVTGRYVLRDFSFERWDWGTYEISYKEGEFIHFYDQYFYYSEVKDGGNTIVAPTLQMAMKWLRKVHNIFIVIEPHTYDYISEKNSSYVASLWQEDNYYENITSKHYPTYEQTSEAVIKYCLINLI